jgi:pyrophosphatase PpaX
MQPNYYIFDFDGTLADTHELILESFVQTGLNFDFNVDQEWVKANIGMELEQMLLHLIPTIPTQKAVDYFRQYQLKHLLNLDFFPNVLDTLKSLKSKGYKMSILTQKSNCTINKFLIAKRERDMFDFVLGRDDITKAKPDPEGLFKLAKLLQTNVSNLIMIGDSFADIEAGKNAGCTTIAVAHNGEKFSQRILNLKPDYLIDSFGEIALL